MADGVTASDLAEGFFYLQADGRHQFTQLLTRPFRSIPGIGEILIGLDHDALRHLLIPITVGSSTPSFHGGGTLKLSLRDAGTAGHFLDLTCAEPSLSFVFERLCADVIDRLEGAANSPSATVKSTLEDWRALFSGNSSELDRESRIGLIGELEILSALARRDPVAALESWVGPTRALHDFTLNGFSLEVKCTSTQGGERVTISSLDQLDPATAAELYLAAVHVQPDSSAPSIDDRVRSLLEIGVPEYGLIQKVGAYGHLFESGQNEDALFGVRGVRYWRVTDSFPGLRRSDFDETRLTGIEKVEYDLVLDTAGAVLTGDEQVNMEKRFAWEN